MQPETRSTTNRRTPFEKALDKDNTEWLRNAITTGADINAHLDRTGNTPLHFACRNNAIRCITLLVLNGANVNAANKNGYTPIDYCSAPSGTALKFMLMNGGLPGRTANDALSGTYLYFTKMMHIAETLRAAMIHKVSPGSVITDCIKPKHLPALIEVLQKSEDCDKALFTEFLRLYAHFTFENDWGPAVPAPEEFVEMNAALRGLKPATTLEEARALLAGVRVLDDLICGVIDEPTETNSAGTQFWRNKKGQYHRLGDKPAIIFGANGSTECEKRWYIDGLEYKVCKAGVTTVHYPTIDASQRHTKMNLHTN